MESIMIQRLSAITDQIQVLTDEALGYIQAITKETLSNAEVTNLKLETAINRFTTELHNYFKLSQTPSPDEISEFSAIQLKGEETLAELKIKLKGKSCDLSAQSSGSVSKFSGNLPKLNLPEFTGDVLSWHEFWDQFASNIDNRNLPEVDKLLYLKSALKGDAKRTVDGLETTNKNYQIAVSTLKERYGRTNHIIDAHYSALYKIKPAGKETTECRRTLNEVERHLRVLYSLGEDINHNNLRFLIMEKFPNDIVYEMRMKIKSESIDEIRKNLEVIIAAREDAERMTRERTTCGTENFTVETLHVQGKLSNKHKKFNKGNREWLGQKFKFGKFENKAKDERSYDSRKRPSDNRKNYKKGKQLIKKRKLECIFCNGEHYNDECRNVKTVTDRKTKLKNRCFNCFSKGHGIKYCRRKISCYHCGQLGRHNRALCPKLETKVEPTKTLHLYDKGRTILQTAVAVVRNGRDTSKKMKCRIILDTGSQRSYVVERVARNLNMSAEEENLLSVFTFGSTTPKEIKSPVVKLQVETKSKDTVTLFMNVVPYISQGVRYPEQELRNWKDRTVLADDGSLSDQVDILIGNDYYYGVMSTEKIKIKENLFLVDSHFGWILSGSIKTRTLDELSVVTYFQSSTDVKLNQPDPPLDNSNLKLLWDLESIGITDSPKISRDEEAVKNFNETTKYIDNRYTVRWPWNEYPPILPTNFGLAFGRLVSQLKRLDHQALLAYDQILKEQLKQGVIEMVPRSTDEETNRPVHYLPHHGVLQPGKSIRIVYDASAKTKDTKSLNECLYCGPMMLENLTGLLIRFRSHLVGISADVEKAFLQIALQDCDRDVTRFLWLNDITKAATEDNLIQLRFCRVPFGVISSPFLLNGTIKHHLLKSGDKRIQQIANEIYVDNLVTGTRSIDEAKELYKTLKDEFGKISMNLREWSSNSKEFMECIPDICNEDTVKILGLKWSLPEDRLSLRFKLIKTEANTKRGILKIVASVYDPCGFAVPSLLPAKLILQDLWRNRIKWDTPLCEKRMKEWTEIQNHLKDIENLSVLRCYMVNPNSREWQLHCFSDASTKAYAAVVYLVSGKYKSFVIGKSRLVPLKDQDNLKIPRLELLGVLIGSRLVKFTLSFLNMNVTQQILWTDSQIVIDWYNSNKLLPPFVARRIEEIRQNKQLTIRYVPSELNPADGATRPTCSKSDQDQWLKGPNFLLEQPNKWPIKPLTDTSLLAREGPLITDVEIRNQCTELETGKQDLKKNKIKSIKNHKLKDNQNTLPVEVGQQKGVEELNTVKEILKIQKDFFPEECAEKETNLSRNLDLFKDDEGILRCKGRLKYAGWSFDKQYPVLVPKDCEFTNKMIMKLHEENYHVGVNHTLSIIRQLYWIPQGRRQVQKILRNCKRCVKHGGGPFKLPPTPALPPERVNYSSPFTFTGIDYLGPVLVKTEEGTSKRWICLFTCLAVRAIHLEVVEDLTAEEGLLALRRFVSTRGIPTLITSDNATQFKLLAKILAKPYCIGNMIRWRFIPQLAPWFGGFYERMVGMVKHCMKRTLEKHLLKDSQLMTVMKEIEAVLNMRPLTCVDSELQHVLKPADFLTVGRCIATETVSSANSVVGTATKRDLVHSWRKTLTVLEEFKNIFSNQYLPSLRERYWHSHKEPRVTSKAVPCEGQIVQIKGDSKNREVWKVGRITSLIKGTDGLCRVAKVKVDDTEYIRSIAQLYPLEIEELPDKRNSNAIDAAENVPIKYLPLPTFNTDAMEIPEEGVDQINIETSRGTQDVVHEKASPRMMDNESLVIPESTNEIQSNEQDGTGESKETRPRRDAAARALEKIKEWTRDLTTLL